MTAADALTTLIRPTLATLGTPFESPEAECLLLAIGLQESGFVVRRQEGGPAHGFWQFEIEAVRQFCEAGDERIQEAVGLVSTATLYHAIATPAGDRAACLMARDLLWHDPEPLPAVDHRDAAFAYYIRNWRPGKPSWARWSAQAYPQAVGAIGV